MSPKVFQACHDTIHPPHDIDLLCLSLCRMVFYVEGAPGIVPHATASRGRLQTVRKKDPDGLGLRCW